MRGKIRKTIKKLADEPLSSLRIPTMLTKKMQNQLLRYMYEAHVTQFGHKTTNFEASSLMTLGGEELASRIPGIRTELNGLVRYLVIDVAEELERRQLVQFGEDGCRFWMTPAGFHEGGKSKCTLGLEWLNQNAGVLSVIAILVSFAALFI